MTYSGIELTTAAGFLTNRIYRRIQLFSEVITAFVIQR